MVWLRDLSPLPKLWLLHVKVQGWNEPGFSALDIAGKLKERHKAGVEMLQCH